VEREEVEADDERVDQNELQRADVADGAEQVAGNPGGGHQAGSEQRAVGDEQEAEDRARETLPGRRVRRVVVETHERRVTVSSRPMTP
jgi:hypothetical protein